MDFYVGSEMNYRCAGKLHHLNQTYSKIPLICDQNLICVEGFQQVGTTHDLTGNSYLFSYFMCVIPGFSLEYIYFLKLDISFVCEQNLWFLCTAYAFKETTIKTLK